MCVHLRRLRGVGWLEQISRGVPRALGVTHWWAPLFPLPLYHPRLEPFENLGRWPYMNCIQPSPLECEHSGFTVPINLRAKSFLGKARWSSKGEWKAVGPDFKRKTYLTVAELSKIFFRGEGWRNCYISWLWWWLHNCLCLSKLTESCTKKEWILLYVNGTLTF